MSSTGLFIVCGMFVVLFLLIIIPIKVIMNSKKKKKDNTSNNRKCLDCGHFLSKSEQECGVCGSKNFINLS